MTELSLAVQIADLVAHAEAPLDVHAEADQLADAHPEAMVNRAEIAEALRQEGDAKGLGEKTITSEPREPS
jgi:hypothetical protein